MRRKPFGVDTAGALDAVPAPTTTPAAATTGRPSRHRPHARPGSGSHRAAHRRVTGDDSS
ncbi:hypothetical protein [Micromonospora rosaria]|uniref:hypothetical protein n=1 Tax=Micromonospora rosaria TaxID=47874 RepID=UPI000A9AB29B|nr:hypothetical protein [Micromonospora rosaria]